MKDDDDACLQRPSIVQTNTNRLNAADFIILGVRSLIHFGNVCKTFAMDPAQFIVTDCYPDF